jgi:hypothetical protein
LTGVPAIALTGFGRPEDVARAREVGFHQSHHKNLLTSITWLSSLESRCTNPRLDLFRRVRNCEVRILSLKLLATHPGKEKRRHTWNLRKAICTQLYFRAFRLFRMFRSFSPPSSCRSHFRDRTLVSCT